MSLLEGDEVKTVELTDMPSVEGNEEQVKSEPKVTAAERVKLNFHKKIINK